MACLNLAPGLLLPSNLQWLTASAPTPAGVSITSESGNFPGISIAKKGGDAVFIERPTGGDQRFMIFGNPANFILVLTIDNADPGFQATRRVVLVDTTGPGIKTKVVFEADTTSTTPLPVVLPSPVSGSIFLIRGAVGAGPDTKASICRSDTGETLCSAVPFNATNEVTGEVTATHLLIKDGGKIKASEERPLGKCGVTPDPGTFPDVLLGAGVDPAKSVSELTFTVRNDGDDCLAVDSIPDIEPYSVVGSTPGMPTVLNPKATMKVTVRFAPKEAKTQWNADLPIAPTPPAGDTVLRCRGEARQAKRTLGFASSLGFQTVPLGSSRTLPLTITNTGEAALAVTVPAGTGEFAWKAYSGALAPGASTTLDVTFTPQVEGSRSGTIAFTSDATGSPHSVALEGFGCVARAGIQVQVPPGPMIDLGKVQRGFRMVRMIRVRNPGNGPLSFTASVSGSPLWGVQEAGGSPLSADPSRVFAVAPQEMCGAGLTGSGEVEFAVTFHAADEPGVVKGELVIGDHNAEGGAFSYPLQATIVPGVAVDVELVLDRSGSMEGSSGSRTKMQAAIEAAQLFVQLGRVDVGDRVGLVRFSTTAEAFSPIDLLTKISQPVLVGAINPAALAPDGNTSIAGGVMTALRDMADHLRDTQPDLLNQAVLVLTDGIDNEPYTAPDGETYSLLGGDGTKALTVPEGVRMYAVGIGDGIDAARLGQLAQATDGAFLPVTEAAGEQYFQMEKHFTQVYMDTVEMATLLDPVFTVAAGETHVTDFDVLRGDVSLMAVVYDREGVRLPFRLRTPSGETVGLGSIPPGYQVRPGITATARFLEVRMPLGQPDRYAGTWQAIVEHDGQACATPPVDGERPRVHVVDPPEPAGYPLEQFGPGFRPQTCRPWHEPLMYGIALGVGSNFRMAAFVEPGVVRVGEPIRLNALVSEFGLPVRGCTVTVTAESPAGAQHTLTLRDDGAHGDGEPDDGDYGASFTHTYAEGNYLFTFRATGHSCDGEPVHREAVRGKYVEGRTPLVPVDVPGGLRTGPGDECCRRIQLWMWIGCVLLLLILFVLLLMLSVMLRQ